MEMCTEGGYEVVGLKGPLSLLDRCCYESTSVVCCTQD